MGGLSVHTLWLGCSSEYVRVQQDLGLGFNAQHFTKLDMMMHVCNYTVSNTNKNKNIYSNQEYKVRSLSCIAWGEREFWADDWTAILLRSHYLVFSTVAPYCKAELFKGDVTELN